MPNQPTLALARMIVKAYLRDDFILLIIYGTPRIGKSAYAIKVMGQVIEYLWGEDIYNIRTCQKYMGWDPNDNVNRWIDLYKRIPGYIWDDAGYWLFSLNWTDPLLIAVQQYMNVIGTDMNSLMLTSPDPTWILSKIATMPGMIRVRITKRDGGRRDDDAKLYSRRAIGYRPWKSPDLKSGGVNRIIEDDYSCKLPEPFYSDWYKPTRESYARTAKMAMREELKRRGEARLKGKKAKRKRGRPRKYDKAEDE